MSFAAVTGLIALAEWEMARRARNPDAVVAPGLFGRARRYVLGIAVASIVAGLATAPFAIFHFDRASQYGLLANLLAMPVVGLVIMPAATAAMVLMPFGLDRWPLLVMGKGVGLMLAIAHWVASLPGAAMMVPAWPQEACCWCCSGVCGSRCGAALALAGRRPDCSRVDRGGPGHGAGHSGRARWRAMSPCGWRAASSRCCMPRRTITPQQAGSSATAMRARPTRRSGRPKTAFAAMPMAARRTGRWRSAGGVRALRCAAHRLRDGRHRHQRRADTLHLPGATPCHRPFRCGAQRRLCHLAGKGSRDRNGACNARSQALERISALALAGLQAASRKAEVSLQ